MLDFGFYNMDCMDGMKEFPDKFFDLAIVDPPYRNMSENQPTKDMRERGTMAKFGNKPDQQYFNELFRVSREQIIWGANNFTLPNYKGFIVWDKGISQDFTMSMAELAFISDGLGTISKIVKIRSAGSDNGVKIHPTQKPVSLYEWLLTRYAKQGDKILDTHVGSASSLIACHKLGFPFVGFELDETYYNMARKRLEAEQAQMCLFEEVSK